MDLTYPELLGYVGSFLMFSTFYMKTMIPLRVTAIAANGCMITYTALSGIYPVLILQACLLPLNIVRLVQMRRLVAQVKESARGDFRIDPLLPFMRREQAAAGDTLFREGDTADKMYLIQRGRVRLLGIDKILGPGDVMGEIGVAVVVPRDRDRPPTLEQLRAAGGEELSAHKLPEDLRVVDELPLTAASKLDRAALRAIV